uniref:SFRICE_039597 n=1 Tax=Spodoptera frugiperda TaxID=7108 RepID=A0A2H1WQ67_SPOFR
MFVNASTTQEKILMWGNVLFKKKKKAIKSIDLTPMYDMSDVNQATDYLISTLNYAVDQNTRSVTTTRRKHILKPWITPGLLRCMRNRDNLYKKAKRNPNDDTMQLTYKRYRTFCNNILKKVKNRINKAGKYNKKLWELISSQDPIKSVNEVNSFFVTIGKTLVEKCKQNNPSSQADLSDTNSLHHWCYYPQTKTKLNH